jgi:hypothetical protein
MCGGCAVFAGGVANEIDKAAKDAQPSKSSVSAPADSSSGDSDTSGDSQVAKIGTEGFTYNDGLTVQVLSAKRYTIPAINAGAKPGDIGVLVTVKITNGSTEVFDLSLAGVKLKAGPDGLEAESVYDDVAGDGFSGSVAPRRNASATFGFAVPKGSLPLVNIEVQPSWDHDASIFEGRVTARK